jgi:hypothetical protein
MSYDFRADQTRTKKIIASGSTNTGAKLLIYPIDADKVSLPNQGVIDPAKFDTSAIGTDVFVFVSGSISSKGVSDSHGTTTFGGDVYTSGSAYFYSPSYFNSSPTFNSVIYAYGGLFVTFPGIDCYGPLKTYNYGAKFTAGLSGSLQCLSTGEPYIKSGTGISVVTTSIGQIEITNLGAPLPCYIPIAGYTTIDATMGTVQIGAIPTLFNTSSFQQIGYTLDLSLEMIGFTGNSQTATLTLYDETALSSVCVLTFSSAKPSLSIAIPTFNVGSHIYTANLSVAGSTVADYAVVCNAALIARWH